MAKGDDLQERLIDFAVKIINLCSHLPKTQEAKHISGQLLRCGTSPAANYGEARGAESRADFVHKLAVVLKELNESKIWLEILLRSKIQSYEVITPVSNECGELSRIINASIKTVGKKK